MKYTRGSIAILTLIILAISTVASTATLFNLRPRADEQVGAFRPSGYIGKLLTRLTEGGAESTFNTTPGTAPDGTSLTTAKLGDFIVITVNPGAANEEKISASAVSVSGTTATWTIVNRGLSYTENTAVTANKKQHAIGETVIISNDDHYLNQQYVDVDSAQTIVGVKTFSGVPLIASSTSFSAANQVVNKSYVDGVAVAGASNADTSTKGIVEIATSAETASSTATGGTSAALVPANSIFSGSATSSTIVPVTRSSGKLGQWFLDLTEAFSWSGAHTFTGAVTHNATTTLASSTITSAITANSVLVSGGSSSAVSGVAASSTGTFLQSNGTSWTAGFISPTSANSGNVTLTANATTQVLSLSGHRAGATVFAACGAQNATNNQTFTFTLSSSGTFSSGSAPSCAIGSGTGGAGGCALNAVVTNTTATSTTFSIQNSNATQSATAHCAAFTIN